MSAITAVALYYGSQTATRLAEAYNADAAAWLHLLQPAISFGVLMGYLACGYPTASKLIAGMTAVGAVVTWRMTNNPMQRRFLADPAAAGATAIVVAPWAPGAAAVAQTGVPALVLLLHVTAVVHELVLRLIFPAPVIAHFAELPRLRARFATHNKNITEVQIPSGNAQLSAAVIYHPRMLAPEKATRWVVYMGGNGEVWEHSVGTVGNLGQALAANGLVFNFRGVGKSGGAVRSAADMVADGNAAVAFLLQRYTHLAERDILLFGHSIGGGIAAQVVAGEHPGCSVLLDRTFSTLEDAAVAMMGLPRPLTRVGVNAAFGDFDSVGAWKAITSRGHDRALVTYHKADRVIPFGGAALARLFGGSPAVLAGAHDKVIELVGDSPDAHNCDLFALSNSNKVVERLESFFPKK
jgi:alpha/beta superfamily hydrolase